MLVHFYEILIMVSHLSPCLLLFNYVDYKSKKLKVKGKIAFSVQRKANRGIGGFEVFRNS
jgi:hypothetical protein